MFFSRTSTPSRRDTSSRVRGTSDESPICWRYARRKAEDVPKLTSWARFWQQWASSAFLRAYLQQMGDAALVPRAREDLSRLLGVLVLEKNMYELGYELNNRPEWVRVPLASILRTLGGKP